MRYLYLFAFIIFINNAWGAYYNSVTSGNWNDPATWGTTSFPSQGDNVTIKSGHTVLLNIELMSTGSQNGLKSLTVESGATLNSTNIGNLLFAANSTMTIYGTCVLNCFRLKQGAVANVYGSFTVINCATLDANSNIGVNGHVNFGGSVDNSGTISGSGSIDVQSGGSVNGPGTIFGIPSNTVAPGQTISSFTWRSTAITTEWNNPANWSGGAVPLATSQVAIMAGSNQPIVNISASVKTMTINPNATVTFNSPGSLLLSDSLILKTGSKLVIGANASATINGFTKMEGSQCLQILSNASGTGSFIDNGISGTGTAKIQRYASASKWHFVSAPVTNALSGVYVNQYLKPFDETINNWGNYIVPTNIPLPSGIGYAMWPVASTAFEFIGTPASGTVAPPLTYSGADKGYNLIGNPYPSALDWNSVSGFNGNNITDWIIIWNQQYNNYGAYQRSTGSSTNGVTRYIPVGQGFFVLANGPSPSLTINRNARVHNFTQPFLKSTSGDDLDYLKLSFKGLEGMDEIILNFLETGSARFDVTEDCRKWYGNANAPQAYTMSEGEQVTVNTLPELEMEDYIIPVYFKSGLNGDYTIICDGISTISYDYDLFLEDNLTHDIIDLRIQQEHVFSSAANNPEQRFLLHIRLKALGTNDITSGNPYSVYSSGKSVIISSSDEMALPADICVYDISGRLMSEITGVNEKVISIPTDASAGIYIIKVKDLKGNIYTEKISIR